MDDDLVEHILVRRHPDGQVGEVLSAYFYLIIIVSDMGYFDSLHMGSVFYLEREFPVFVGDSTRSTAGDGNVHIL